MALPRVLSLSPDGELEMSIAPEAQSLRGKFITCAKTAIRTSARRLCRQSICAIHAPK